MDLLFFLIDLILHVDKHLDLLIQDFGVWIYLILFLIVFCETGLVVTPFLPGDSLLFAAGAFAARGSLDLAVLVILLIVAAIVGDAVNYAIGRYLGEKAFSNPNSKIFRRSHLEKTKLFFEHYGAKAIVIARFVPIVRTFAPFVAGVGKMPYGKFALYNVLGAILWVLVCTVAGYLFGGLAIVKNNFSLVVLGIILVSILPMFLEFIRFKVGKKALVTSSNP